MIDRLSHAPIWVANQDDAKEFYVERLGFEVRSDVTMDGFRWLTVAPKDQPDVDLILIKPGPPMHDEQSASEILALVAKGAFSGGVLDTSDCRAAFDDLSAKGVTFLQEPAERPYGVEAVFRDDSGNWFSLRQPGW
jgi:catechol 2,3-dioxygenase-like lactoylglutathione lyase family enzyme